MMMMMMMPSPLHALLLVQFRGITNMIAARGRRKGEPEKPERAGCLPQVPLFPESGGGSGGAGRGRSISGASIIVSVYAAITCPEEEAAHHERVPSPSSTQKWGHWSWRWDGRGCVL